MDHFWKITRGTQRPRSFYVKGEWRPSEGTLHAYIAGQRWIKTTQKWSSNRYCFSGQIQEVTEQEATGRTA